MVQAKKFIYVKQFQGMPKVTDFRLEIETLPDLCDGGNINTKLFLMYNLFSFHSKHHFNVKRLKILDIFI